MLQTPPAQANGNKSESKRHSDGEEKRRRYEEEWHLLHVADTISVMYLCETLGVKSFCVKEHSVFPPLH